VSSTGGYDRNNRTVRSSSGGSYRMVLKYPDHLALRGKTTLDTDVVEARFTELVPNERVVYSVEFVSDDPDYDRAMAMRWGYRHSRRYPRRDHSRQRPGRSLGTGPCGRSEVFVGEALRVRRPVVRSNDPSSRDQQPLSTSLMADTDSGHYLWVGDR